MKDLYVNIYLTNLKKYTEGDLIGGWITVDIDTDWSKTIKELCYIGCDDFGEEVFVSDYETNISELNINEYTSIEELQELSELIEYANAHNLQSETNDIIKAVKELDVNRIMDILENQKYFYLADIGNDEKLGEYLVENDETYSHLPDNIKQYLDRERIGEDFCINNAGMYQNGNYIELLY